MTHSRTIAATLLVSVALVTGACASDGPEPTEGAAMHALIDGDEQQLSLSAELAARSETQRLTLTGTDSVTGEAIAIDVDLDPSIFVGVDSASVVIASTATFPETTGSAMLTSAIRHDALSDQTQGVRGAWVTGGCRTCYGAGSDAQQLAGRLSFERVGDTLHGTLVLDVVGAIPFYGASSVAHEATFEASFAVQAPQSTEPAPAPEPGPSPAPAPHPYEVGCGGPPGSR